MRCAAGMPHLEERQRRVCTARRTISRRPAHETRAYGGGRCEMTKIRRSGGARVLICSAVLAVWMGTARADLTASYDGSLAMGRTGTTATLAGALVQASVAVN